MDPLAGSMFVVYVAALLAGACLLVVRFWIERPPGDAPAAREARPWAGDLGLPGTRAESSDEYIAGGGVGGAEGEGVPPANHAPADGGIGGAEGDDDLPDLPERTRGAGLPLAVPVAARFCLTFGAVGLLLSLWSGIPPEFVLLAAVGAAIVLAASLGTPARSEGEAPRAPRRTDG